VAQGAGPEKEIASYEAFADDYPLTVCGVLAKQRAVEARRAKEAQETARKQRLTELLKVGRSHEKIGDNAGARRVYAAIIQAGESALQKKALARIQELDHLEKQGKALLEQALAHDTSGDREECYRLMKQLVTRYGTTEAAARAVFPVSVDSAPSGAKLLYNGVKRGVTPLVIRIPAGDLADVKLTYEGHKPLETTLEPEKGSSFCFALSRREIWKAQLPRPAKMEPLLHRARLYVVGNDATIYAYAADTAEELGRWAVPGATDIVRAPVGVSGPGEADVVFATNDGRIGVITGAKDLTVWPTAGLIATPLLPLEGSAVCFGTSKRKICRLSLTSGKAVWETAVPKTPENQAVLAGEVAVFLCRDNRLRAFSHTTGHLRWEREVMQGCTLTAFGDEILVGHDKQVTLVKANWGNDRWAKDLDKPGVSYCIGSRAVWVSADDGTVTVLDVRTGQELGSRRFAGPVTAWCPVPTGMVVRLKERQVWSLSPQKLEAHWFYDAEKVVNGMARAGEGRMILLVGGQTLTYLKEN
jgi:hypothetical protein